jgi:hypothetical protein
MLRVGTRGDVCALAEAISQIPLGETVSYTFRTTTAGGPASQIAELKKLLRLQELSRYGRGVPAPQ